jgi:hypothetical protein
VAHTVESDPGLWPILWNRTLVCGPYCGIGPWSVAQNAELDPVQLPIARNQNLCYGLFCRISSSAVALSPEPNSSPWPIAQNQLPDCCRCGGKILNIEYLCEFEFDTALGYESWAGWVRFMNKNQILKPIMGKIKDPMYTICTNNPL